MRMRSSLLFASLLTFVVTGGGIAAQTASTPARATIRDVAWLAHDWRSDGQAVVFEERWTPPAGGAMLAVARTVKGDRMVAFEYLRIVERKGGLVYVAQPDGRPPTEFVATSVSSSEVVFENPAHDFPRMIRYTRKDDGGLEAEISDGGAKKQAFVFRRASATP